MNNVTRQVYFIKQKNNSCTVCGIWIKDHSLKKEYIIKIQIVFWKGISYVVAEVWLATMVFTTSMRLTVKSNSDFFYNTKNWKQGIFFFKKDIRFFCAVKNIFHHLTWLLTLNTKCVFRGRIESMIVVVKEKYM